jgi:hypothetical protein
VSIFFRPFPALTMPELFRLKKHGAKKDYDRAFEPQGSSTTTLSGIPAIEIGNGLARIGTQVFLNAHKGVVTAFDNSTRMVTVRVEDGSEMEANATEVTRQHPHPPGTILNSSKHQYCAKCHGSGEKESWFAVFGPRPCPECRGSGRLDDRGSGSAAGPSPYTPSDPSGTREPVPPAPGNSPAEPATLENDAATSGTAPASPPEAAETAADP